MASRKSAIFYVWAAGIVIVDQLTKIIARDMLPHGRSVTIIPGFFDLRLGDNAGAAFGLFPQLAPLFIIIAVVAMFAIVKLRAAGPDSRALSIGLGLLLGGAVGNLIDRLTSPAGAVTDFLSFHIGTHEWPTFNIADAAIVVGALMTFFYVYIVQKRGDASEREEH